MVTEKVWIVWGGVVVDVVGLVIIAILLALSGCDFPDSLVVSFLALIYWRVRLLERRGD